MKTFCTALLDQKCDKKCQRDEKEMKVTDGNVFVTNMVYIGGRYANTPCAIVLVLMIMFGMRFATINICIHNGML